MKIFNYYETLTEDQKLKHGDKKGALLYYEWFSRLYENVSLEVAGAMLLATIFYDMHGGSKKLPPKLMKVIKSDKTAEILFETLLERTHAGSREWINRRGRKTASKTTSENNTETDCTKVPKEYDVNDIIDDLPF